MPIVLEPKGESIMKTRTSIHILKTMPFCLCLFWALAGCASTASTPPTSATEVGASAQQPLTSTTDYIGEENAKNIAFEHAGFIEDDLQFVQTRLERDDGHTIYEVEFWNGNTEYDYDIDALTGEIIGFSQDVESNAPALPQSAANATSSTAEYITAEQAKEIALQNAGVNASDAQNLQCEFEHDDGRAEYELDWNVGPTEYEYTIDATDGAILAHSMD